MDGAGDPVPDAVIELYQADGRGRYPDSTEPSAPSARAPSRPKRPARRREPRLFSPASAACRPDRTAAACSRRSGPASCATNGIEQAPHINVCLLARGLLRQIYTRIYFKDDPALATDPILALVPADRRSTLFARARRRASRVSGSSSSGCRETGRRCSSICETRSRAAASLDCLATTDPLAAIFSDDERRRGDARVRERAGARRGRRRRDSRGRGAHDFRGRAPRRLRHRGDRQRGAHRTPRP